MLKDAYPYYLANEAVFANQDLDVTDKYSGEVATRVAMADAATIDKAIDAADKAAAAMAKLAPYERQAILYHCVKRFEERYDELALALCIEAGKPIKDARGEVGRLIDTFRVAAEEAVRIDGEMPNLEISARAKGYRGMVKRVPIGPCSFISPFNFPLNLAAHKVAPAIAAGCDERFKLLSFTGSPDVGWDLKARAGKKPVILELGGNAAVIVDEDADLNDAVERIVFGAFYQSGQSCIGVQRILIHDAIYDELKARLVEKTAALKMGDPKDEDTFIGPVISEGEAKRLENWINEAVDAGATLLVGGQRNGAMLEATLLENAPKGTNIVEEEAFGPVAVVSRFSDFDDALNTVNDSKFGLQAGIFTRDLYKAQKAWDELEVGGVVIGDVPSWRVDNMPYGGVKDSGLGREGIRWAINDMTEERLLVIRTPQS